MFRDMEDKMKESISEIEDRVKTTWNKTKKDQKLKRWMEHQWAVGVSGSIIYMLLEFWRMMAE